MTGWTAVLAGFTLTGLTLAGFWWWTGDSRARRERR